MAEARAEGHKPFPVQGRGRSPDTVGRGAARALGGPVWTLRGERRTGGLHLKAAVNL